MRRLREGLPASPHVGPVSSEQADNCFLFLVIKLRLCQFDYLSLNEYWLIDICLYGYISQQASNSEIELEKKKVMQNLKNFLHKYFTSSAEAYLILSRA